MPSRSSKKPPELPTQRRSKSIESSARLVLVFGQAQKGKTTLALEMLQNRKRLLVLDPVRSKPISQLIHKGAHEFKTWEELASFLVTANGPWVAVLRSMNDDDYCRAFEHARYLRHATILADEGLHYVSHQKAKELLIKTARANAHFGDGIGVPLWVTAQRPYDLPPDVRSQATNFISFRQEETADLQMLSQRCNPQFAEDVSKLVGHDWLMYPPRTEGD